MSPNILEKIDLKFFAIHEIYFVLIILLLYEL